MIKLIAVFLLASTAAGAAELTVDDLARGNEKLTRELAGMKQGYLMRYGDQPVPGIADFVACLKDARNYSLAICLREMVLHPDEALPLLHAQLGDPDLSETGFNNTVAAISLIGHPESVDAIIRLTHDDTPYVYRSAWLALTIMPTSEAARERALEIFNDTNLELHSRQIAAIYLALAREERARPAAEAMLQSDDVLERASAIMVLGYLGEDIRQSAVEVLQDPEVRHGLDFEPLRGLAEIAGPDEMRALVPESKQGGSAWHHELWRSTWLHDPPADEGERTLLCFNLLRSDFPLPSDLAISIQCLLDLGRQDLVLRDILIGSYAVGSYVLTFAQRQGWSMIVTEDDIYLERKAPVIPSNVE